MSISYRIVIKLPNSFKSEVSARLYDTYKGAQDDLNNLQIVLNKAGFKEVLGMVETIECWEFIV